MLMVTSAREGCCNAHAGKGSRNDAGAALARLRQHDMAIIGHGGAGVAL